jgi:hypothetical protein
VNRLLVDGVAVYRLTKLVTDDSITEPLRTRFVALTYRAAGRPIPDHDDRELAEAAMDDPDHPKLAELASCRWCAGMHLALGVVFVARRFRWWPDMADALALSAAGALIARLEE